MSLLILQLKKSNFKDKFLLIYKNPKTPCLFFIIYPVSSDGRVKYSDVRAFLDKDETTIGHYMSITTVTNNTIALSANHLIYANKNINDKFIPM